MPVRFELAVQGIDKQSARLRRLIGVVGHDPLLYDDLTARENLRFVCRMFALDGIEERVHSAADRMGMALDLDRKIGAMSHGMKKRFSIARALLHDPQVLLLDEPETGLDQEALSLLDSVVARGSDSSPYGSHDHAQSRARCCPGRPYGDSRQTGESLTMSQSMPPTRMRHAGPMSNT